MVNSSVTEWHLVTKLLTMVANQMVRTIQLTTIRLPNMFVIQLFATQISTVLLLSFRRILVATLVGHWHASFLSLKISFRTRGQSYKDFYTLGQIYKRVLNHKNNALTKTFIWHNVRTLHPNILVDLHFYSGLKRHFRYFILHHPKV